MSEESLLYLNLNNIRFDAISLDCKIIWKVENRKPNRRNLPFENIFLNNRILTATDFYGKRYFINITNGLIEKTDIVK